MRKTTDVRTAAAARAVRLAKRARIDDHRLGFSFFTRARAVASTDPIAAVRDYTRAYAIFLQAFGPDDVHTAHVALQLASFSVSVGDFGQALQYIEPSLVGAKLAQNGRLMLSLLAMKAAIYEKQGRLTEAKAIYQEAIGWGHYGVHAPSDITARLQLISDLFPKTPLTEG
jgi:tetratricopeptide (TPR) repeat protein